MHGWRYLSNYNLPGRSKRNVKHHYDIGEELYDLFLDKKHRQYSCAYFLKENESLEEAQQNKINHIIKKLNLKSGQKVLDIGCGWGGMAFEIARQSQCEVTGISLSENQIKYAKEKAKKLNLDNQVHFKLCDYRSLQGKYDRVVSVGAFEHFGKKFYKTFFKIFEVKSPVDYWVFNPQLILDEQKSFLFTINFVTQPYVVFIIHL